MTRVSVCIATCRRPQGLVRLLGALDALALPEDVTLRVVVVDNDAEASARDACAAAASRIAHPVRYLLEKRPGIPQARNRALAEASGADLVAFIDDDEVPEPEWLAALLRLQQGLDADAVAGPCLPRFEAPPPAWVEKGRFFERPRFAHGARLEVAFTHNVLVRRAALDALAQGFDERLALCGGSDVELFRRLHRRGFRIVWADDAVVHETIPASRARLAWLLRRALRVGASNARIRRLHQPGPACVFFLLGHGSWCLAKAAALLLGCPFRGREAAARSLHLASFGAGRIAGALGARVDEYAAAHRR